MFCRKWQALLIAENSTSQQPTRKGGPWSYSHKKLYSVNNLNEHGRGIRSLDEISALAKNLIST